MTLSAFCAAVTTFGLAALFGSSAAYAAPIYPTTNSIGISETGLTLTANSGGYLYHTTISATNNSAVTLYNIFEFSRDLSISGVAASLMGAGQYVSPTSGQAVAANAAIYITPGQSNYGFDAASAGSSTMADIPGFFIASSLNAGQTVSFTEDFEVTGTPTSLNYFFVNTASVAPEPSAMVLTGTGLLAAAAALRRRLSSRMTKI